MATALPRLADRVGRYREFRLWLRLAMGVNVAAGLFLLVLPETAQQVLSLPPAASAIWIRYAGLFILAITASYLPAAVYPPAARFLALYAVVVRFVFVVFFLIAGGGFLWFALVDGLFGLTLAQKYLTCLREDLELRP